VSSSSVVQVGAYYIVPPPFPPLPTSPVVLLGAYLQVCDLLRQYVRSRQHTIDQIQLAQRLAPAHKTPQAT
jgi:hypothetical protein